MFFNRLRKKTGKKPAPKTAQSKAQPEKKPKQNPSANVKQLSDQEKLANTIKETGLFQADWYKNYYLDLYSVDLDPLDHFIRFGIHEGRNPNPYFNTIWYRNRYPSDIQNENPVIYYATKGYKQGHNPCPHFNGRLYLQNNPDVANANQEPLSHFLNFGRFEGRKLTNMSSTLAAEEAMTENSQLPVNVNLRGMIDYPRLTLSPSNQVFNPHSLNIHWVIPDFSEGSGGHMTIYRIIHLLETFGHQHTIWIYNPDRHLSTTAAYDDIIKDYQHFSGSIKFVDESFSTASGDAIIATSNATVWPCLSLTNFKRRFYFIQDFEPQFSPMGADYLSALATYGHDLDCICASPWLSKMMQEDFGLWAEHFWLAADTKLYHPADTPPKNAVPRIAVYARHSTARRAVDFAFLGLELIAKRGIKFHADFFGAPMTFSEAPFPFTDHGIASPDTLAKIFQNADIGLVFSATNYSLVPQEMMACGLPIIELDGPSTRAIFPHETVLLAEPNPASIADALAKLIKDPNKRNQQAKTALNWVKQFSWSQSAKIIETALVSRLSAHATAKQQQAQSHQTPYASVIIPTWNAGPLFRDVLDAVTTQNAPWPFEILVIDSGSIDETLSTVKNYPMVKLHQIDQDSFNHGDTRNLGAQLTSGEFIAFLTHDALPADEFWLYNLVSSLEHYPSAAGAFGHHKPWKQASPYTKRDLEKHFEHLNQYPIYLEKNTDLKKFESNNQQWHQILHFFSDNNSCLRRSIWEKIPYQKTAYGEDQLWANDIIHAGYGKVYARRATVFHSHDYNAQETYNRCHTEAAFFKEYFDYNMIAAKEMLEQVLSNMNKNDHAWGKSKNLARKDIEAQKTLNEAKLQGWLDGMQSVKPK